MKRRRYLNRSVVAAVVLVLIYSKVQAMPVMLDEYVSRFVTQTDTQELYGSGGDHLSEQSSQPARLQYLADNTSINRGFTASGFCMVETGKNELVTQDVNESLLGERYFWSGSFQVYGGGAYFGGNFPITIGGGTVWGDPIAYFENPPLLPGDLPQTPVPEPASILLFSSGLIGLGGLSMYRRWRG